jgi:hypothetical protein
VVVATTLGAGVLHDLMPRHEEQACVVGAWQQMGKAPMPAAPTITAAASLLLEAPPAPEPASVYPTPHFTAPVRGPPTV